MELTCAILFALFILLLALRYYWPPSNVEDPLFDERNEDLDYIIYDDTLFE